MPILERLTGKSNQASYASLIVFSIRNIFSIFTFGLIFWGCSVSAQSLGVSPIRVDLSENKRIASITVTNSSNAPRSVQVRLYSWSHSGKELLLSDTKNIVSSPPIATIPANQSQIIRVGMRMQPDKTMEKSYRLILNELPKRSRAGVIMTLKISLPVFVKPSEGEAQANLNWKVDMRNGQPFLVVENKGNGHAKIDTINIAPYAWSKQEAQGNIYVLPNSYYEWRLPPGVKNYRNIQVKASIHGKAVSVSVPVLG